jgi:hypothetical protein
MAPSFAESFFEGGVANLVCTAWPIDDGDARTFALVFYATLLGLKPPMRASDVPLCELDPAGPQTIQTAMRRAREAIASSTAESSGGDASRAGEDARTWGAYQHYGNPSFRLFRGGS